jgi:hypothetical protein
MYQDALSSNQIASVSRHKQRAKLGMAALGLPDQLSSAGSGHDDICQQQIDLGWRSRYDR